MSSMEVPNSAIELMKIRHSSRTYSSQSIGSEIRKQLINFINKEIQSPFCGKARFELFEMKNISNKKKRRIGTYGFIKGAKTYLIGICTNSKHDLENFGYIFEKIILFATQLGLGTCWLGGTFRRNDIESRLFQSLSKKEIIPAISPVGYQDQKTSFREKIITLTARSRKRKDWSSLFFNEDLSFFLSPKDSGKYIIPLEMVRIAPSASNAQPWRIIKEKNEESFHFYIFRKKKVTQRIFSLPDFPRIDLGIAVCHFDLATKDLSLNGEWIIKVPKILTPSNFEYMISWIRR